MRGFPLARSALVAGSLLPLFAYGCAEDPWTYPDREVKSIGAEVFRVLCKREVRESFPEDLEGWAFDGACGGTGTAPRSTARLDAMLSRRESIAGVVDRVLGEDDVPQPEVVALFGDGELQGFLRQIVPLYDLPNETLPNSTRTLATTLARLIDTEDATGQQALDALSEITGRRGYRAPELALGLLRPLLEYPQLDALAEHGLRAIARGGVAEKSLDELSLGLALEMANYDPAPPAPDSTLVIARDLFLSRPDDVVGRLREAEGMTHVGEAVPPGVRPVPIVRRDRRGVALPRGIVKDGAPPAPFMDADADGLVDVDGTGAFVTLDGAAAPTPFAAAGDSGATPRDAQGRAVSGDGQPLFEDFDAQPTLAALVLREVPRLSRLKEGQERTTLEKFGRGLGALFGPSVPRQVAYGAKAVAFDGPDPALAPFHDLVHAAAQTVKANPEAVRRFLEMFTIAMATHEHEMAAFVDMALRVEDRGDRHDEAQIQGLAGPNSSLFWDHVLELGRRMAERPGMVEAVVRSIQAPETEQLGYLIADWMEFVDQAPYVGADMAPQGDAGTWTGEQAANLNAPVTVRYQTPVDYTQPSEGANRSVWQQTMSMVHSLRNQGLCNPDGASFHLPLAAADSGLGLDDLPSVLGIGWGIYAECQVFDIQDMVRIWVQSILGEAYIVLDDAPDLLAFQLTGALDPYQILERESQIDGMVKQPTPDALARFLYGPPNQFVDGITDPAMRDGYPVTEIDPYALFAMEVPHPNAGGLNFMQAGRPLLEAFEHHELTEPDNNAEGTTSLTHGYLFSDLMDVFHLHWGSQSDAPCPGEHGPQCTQRTEPSAPLFSYQSNLRSYEPLMVEILRQDGVIPVLREAVNAWEGITVDGKNGVEIFAEFVETLLAPSDRIAYRDGRTSARDNMGEELGYVSPLYLVLDGLNQIDRNFEAPEYAGAHDSWLEARSEIADLFIAIETVDGKMRLADRMGHAEFTTVLEFLRERIEAHTQAGDLDAWADGLGERSATFFDTPLVAGLVHLFQQSWDEPAAGRELMRFVTYVSDERENPVGFETTLVAMTDLLQLLEDAERIAPLLDLAAEAVIPGAPHAVDGTGNGELAVDQGILRVLVELLNDVLELHPERPSAVSRVAHNLVSTTAEDRQTPLESLIDAVSEVERVDPSLPASAPLTRDDLRTIAASAHEFIRDDGHGLERLYDIIQNRVVAGAPAQPEQQDPSGASAQP